MMHAEIEFGFWDRQFADLVCKNLPKDWIVNGGPYVNRRTGKKYIEVRRYRGLFWDLVDLVREIPGRGPVQLMQKEYSYSEKLIYYKKLN